MNENIIIFVGDTAYSNNIRNKLKDLNLGILVVSSRPPWSNDTKNMKDINILASHKLNKKLLKNRYKIKFNNNR